jgi:hypothetical protein
MDNHNKKTHPNQIKSITDELYSIPVSKIKYHLISVDGESKTVGIILNWNDEEQVKIAVQNHWNKYKNNKNTKSLEHWKNDTNKLIIGYLQTNGIDSDTKDRLEVFQDHVIKYFEEKQPDESNLPDITKKLSIPEKISLLNELGVIESLKDKFPHAKALKISKLLAFLMNEKYTNINPVVSSLISNDSNNRNYPTKSSKVESLINSLL